MADMRFQDSTGRRIAIDDRVRLTDVAGPPLGGGQTTRRFLLDMEGLVVGLDELGDDNRPKGRNIIWVRLDGDEAASSIHPARVTVTTPS